jgi:hypothetical protein
MHRFLCVTLSVASCVMIAGCEPMPTATNAPAPVPTESVKAQAGVGKQGRSLDGETGIGKMISAPASTLFTVKEKVVFEIQIPTQLNHFKAIEGRLPKSHEEYMEKIIKAGQIKLPELPDGKVYRYNVELGELWVDPVTPPNDGAGAPTGANP